MIDGELDELIEDFSEGRVQFAFVKVKDPNSGLPKFVLIAWCGGGVPERTKGYFTSHLNAVSKVLHGYHVQITARSDSDLEVDAIMRKVADASGAKYSAGSSEGARPAAPPPAKSKPVFTPTASSRSNPLVAARSRRDENVDEDGWGADAPQVSRSQLEKVESAYKPTKVNLADLTKQPTATTSGSAPTKRNDIHSDVVKGGYQPIGKVDIAAIRAQAQKDDDSRPTPVKGSYEPVGKVDIAAIRAKAQKPAEQRQEPAEDEEPKPVSERMSAFSQPAQSERLTSLPKPKVANKFGGVSSFSGTKAPAPGGLGFGGPSTPAPPPVGAASRTFADQGGKTPAQLWAEKKARERGNDAGSASTPTAAPPVQAQKSGNEWKSGYAGKSWAPVTTGGYGHGVSGQVSQQNTGEVDEPAEETPVSPSGGVNALRDRFKGTPPISAGTPPMPRAAQEEPSPPPVPDNSRPSGGFALPGLPNRPAAAEEDDEQEDPSAYQTAAERGRSPSPPRIAVPVSRGPQPPIGSSPEQRAPPPVAPSQIDVPREEDLSADKEVSSSARAAAGAVAGVGVGAAIGASAVAAAQHDVSDDEPEYQQQREHSPAPAPVPAAQPPQPEPAQGGYRAVVQYDYEKAEDNEIELVEGDLVTNIDMVDEDWWMGTNSRGETGLFPSNYVEVVEDDEDETAAAPPSPPAREDTPSPPAPAAAAPASAGPTATAIYDYEAAEDNGKFKASYVFIE